MKAIIKFAWNKAERSANSACPWWLYTKELPEKVKKLRKF